MGLHQLAYLGHLLLGCLLLAVFLPLELGALALALHLRGGPSSRAGGAAIIGALIGLATLVRPVGVVMLLPMAIALLGPRPWRSWRLAKAPVIMAVATALTVTPWVVRNVVVMHKAILTTQDGYYLASTYNETSLHFKNPGGTHNLLAVPAFRPFLLHGHLDEVQVDDRLFHEAVEGRAGDLAPCEDIIEGVLVHDTASGRVDQVGVRLHHREFAAAKQAARLFGKGAVY